LISLVAGQQCDARLDASQVCTLSSLLPLPLLHLVPNTSGKDEALHKDEGEHDTE
jgi:hypothetical protein